MLYALAAAIGFVVSLIYTTLRGSKFENSIMRYVLEGKRVVISIDEEALIFQLVNNKIQVSKAMTTMMEEVDEQSSDLANFGSDQSGMSH